jgi:hypothetical protein
MFGGMNNSVTIAVVAGAIIVAATMAVVFRYEVTPVSTTVAHRFDRWTGKIQICTYQLEWNARMTSHPKRPRDPNQLAKSIIDIATGQKPESAYIVEGASQR